MIGLAARSGTDVEPMCSMRRRSAAKRDRQRGSYATISTRPGSRPPMSTASSSSSRCVELRGALSMGPQGYADRLPALPLALTHFTDPACPFAFSAEPVRIRLRWHYGDGLVWTTRMIVLTREPGEAERLAEGAPNLQRIHGMPIDPRPYPRTASSEPACLAVVAARERAPGKEEALLRRLRVRVMQLGLVDEPELIAAAAG